MTVEELVKKVQALEPVQLARFGVWFDEYRQSAKAECDVSATQKAEILRRRDEYLNDSSISSPWEGTAEVLIAELHARRLEKAKERTS